MTGYQEYNSDLNNYVEKKIKILNISNKKNIDHIMTIKTRKNNNNIQEIDTKILSEPIQFTFDKFRFENTKNNDDTQEKNDNTKEIITAKAFEQKLVTFNNNSFIITIL
jgi:hypothetical protein